MTPAARHSLRRREEGGSLSLCRVPACAAVAGQFNCFDPNPYPPDPRAFWPRGSASTSIVSNKSFGSGYGSGSAQKLVLNPIRIRIRIQIRDSNPDSNPGFGSGSESRIRPKLHLFVLKFLLSLIPQPSV